METVNIVVDFADTTMTTLKITVNFDVFSITLKEESGEIKYLGVFTYLIALHQLTIR